ncbi:uncharacterized protein EDB93DRAFT_1247510 [Suillus bovinus]|uniref:uncharacterized protein n=1 Tax=Suillus bovinus TaxID=48563 RepID=UPI001B862FEE|nr:uncharacterized protein EDB93DRAFT_1247510 [Suillus bovinus]KAG2155869.1 hypothetical protein EDB93DRAFT_1247510 [Suillus bovinus]
MKLVNSTNEGNRQNGLDSWICKRCRKRNQAAEIGSKTAVQLLRPKPDDNQQPLPTVQAQSSLGLALPKDERKIDPDVVTRSGGPAGPSIEATAHILHTKSTQHNNRGSQHQQQQGGQMGIIDNNKLLTTTVKSLQVKRVLKEQHLDGPRADGDYPRTTELYPDKPAVPFKYARAPDGKKLVSSGYLPNMEQLEYVKCVNPSHIKESMAQKEDTPLSRSVTLFSERVHSPFTSLSVREEKDVHHDSMVKDPCGNRQEPGTRPNSPPGTSVGHDDIHMKDDSDDLYAPPVPRSSGSTPVPSSSATSNERQGGSVMQESNQTIQQQGVVQSHPQPEGPSSLEVGPEFGVQTSFPDMTQQQTPKAEAEPLLGHDWLKARYSVANDSWRPFCDPQRERYGVSRRKQCTAKFLGDPLATTDRELLWLFFSHDWIHQKQLNI